MMTRHAKETRNLKLSRLCELGYPEWLQTQREFRAANKKPKGHFSKRAKTQPQTQNSDEDGHPEMSTEQMRGQPTCAAAADPASNYLTKATCWVRCAADGKVKIPMECWGLAQDGLPQPDEQVCQVLDWLAPTCQPHSDDLVAHSPGDVS